MNMACFTLHVIAKVAPMASYVAMATHQKIICTKF